jgi:hypothetical protein
MLCAGCGQLLASEISPLREATAGCSFGNNEFRMSAETGPLVGAIIPAASSWRWAKSGFGRRLVFVFESAFLVLETNIGGKPLGVDSLDLGDEYIVAMPEHAQRLVTLDPRNALIETSEIETARLSGDRKRGLYQLDLRTLDRRDFSFYWKAEVNYRKVQEDGALPVADRPKETALADLRSVLGTVLIDETG